MVIITKGTLHAFSDKHPNASAALNDWYEKTKAASCKNLAEVKPTFNSVDAIRSDRYVFNIGGNNYRIIAMIHFNIRTLYIRAILTHQEYNYLNKNKMLNQL